MITRNFEDYPEHRLQFFALLHAIVNHCFRTLLTFTPVRVGLIHLMIVANFKLLDVCAWIFCSYPFFSSPCGAHPSYGIKYALTKILQVQLKLIIDSIVWAFRHTERNVAETGLNLLLDMLNNFSTSDFATQFYQTYYLQLVQVCL